MSSAAVLRAQTVSRMAMSPSHDKNDELMSILQSAKEDLKKEKKMKVEWLNYFSPDANPSNLGKIDPCSKLVVLAVHIFP